jgi:hypothetical protein
MLMLHNCSKELFYGYQFTRFSGLSYVFTKHDFVTKATTNICIHTSNEARAEWIEKLGALVGKSSVEQPFKLHSLIASKSLDEWLIEGGRARSDLLLYVS